MNCPNCGAHVPPNVPHCWRCGCALNGPARSRRFGVPVLVVFGVLVVASAIWLISRRPPLDEDARTPRAQASSTQTSTEAVIRITWSHMHGQSVNPFVTVHNDSQQSITLTLEGPIGPSRKVDFGPSHERFEGVTWTKVWDATGAIGAVDAISETRSAPDTEGTEWLTYATIPPGGSARGLFTFYNLFSLPSGVLCSRPDGSEVQFAEDTD